MSWLDAIGILAVLIGAACPWLLVWAIIHDLKLKDKGNEE